VVEDAPVDEALAQPRHPYTSGLLRSLPRLTARHARLGSIAGRVPSPSHMPDGCRFRARCTHSQPPCEAEQTLRPIGEPAQPSRDVRCCRAEQLELPGAVA
jgi:peptide/nickel transport system ATP-binding protein